jgi:16S rRNA (uracil1498-N3)-methyltransferase
MTRLITRQILEVGETTDISGEELHYLSRVRRHRPGDRVELRDGSGDAFEAEIKEIGRQHARLFVARKTPALRQSVFPVTLAVAVPKRNLMDDVVRKLSEIGVSRLIPLVTHRTDIAPKADKLARWQRIADESLRQCGRELPLEVSEISSFEAFVAKEPVSATKLLLHPEGALSLVEAIPSMRALTLAVGPEGGFTRDEVELARTRGFTPTALQMPILRIETAAVAAAVLAVALREERRVNVPRNQDPTFEP